MLVRVNERGTVENFVLKCTERLCGAAQLEIMDQTKEIMNKYLAATKDSNPEVYTYLLKYSKGARCTFPGFKCTSPCIFGGRCCEVSGFLINFVLCYILLISTIIFIQSI